MSELPGLKRQLALQLQPLDMLLLCFKHSACSSGVWCTCCCCRTSLGDKCRSRSAPAAVALLGVVGRQELSLLGLGMPGLSLLLPLYLVLYVIQGGTSCCVCSSCS